jgi:hypothetical protein
MLKVMTTVVALLVVSPAFGQGSAHPAQKAASTQADVEKEVKRLFDEGQAAATAQQWGKAKAAFSKAYTLLRLPQIAMHLGRAEVRGGDFVAGIEHLQSFLKEKPDADRAEVEAVQELLTEAKAKIATVTLKVDQPGAEVLVDGTVLQEKSLGRPLYLLSGAHTFEVRKKGYLGMPKHLELSAGAEVGVFLNLVPTADAPVEVKTVPARREVGPSSHGGLISAMSIGSGGLLAAGIGSFVWWRVERDRAFDVAKGEGSCTTEDACEKLYEYHASRSENIGYVSMALLGSAVVTGVPSLIAWAITKKSQTNAVKSRETSFMVVPTVGGIRVQGTW